MDCTVDLHAQGAVFTITRCVQLNTLNRNVWVGLEACLDDLEASGRRYLVITGEGERAFSAGSDLKDDVLANWDQQAGKCDRIRSFLLRLSNSPVFSIAAVNGMAHGGGLELALACTQRVAVAQARFSMPEIRLGVIPSYGGTQFLPAVIGRARAAELMLTGRVISAYEALDWGLVSFLGEDGSATLARALAIACEVAEFSADACAAIRRCLSSFGAVPTRASLEVEGHELTRLLAGETAKEGIRRFLEQHSRK